MGTFFSPSFEIPSAGFLYDRPTMWILLLCTLLSPLLVCVLLRILIVGVVHGAYSRFGRNTSNRSKRRSIAFFHPFCDGGGGGERVLWMALSALSHRMREDTHVEEVEIVIYSATSLDVLSLRRKMEKQFGNENGNMIIPSFHLVRITGWEWLLLPSTYPRLTMIGQSIGSMIVALYCLFQFLPDIFIDSTGFLFTIPVAKIVGNCSTACYIHYPTVSTDMIETVSSGQVRFNNSSSVSGNSFLTQVKVIVHVIQRETFYGIWKLVGEDYYKIFALLYGFAGVFADVVMTNSLWTDQHIRRLFFTKRSVIVYPPCRGEDSESVRTPVRERERCILSISQFRPEKNHEQQIRAFAKFLCARGMHLQGTDPIRLLVVGGVRNTEDHERFEKLQLYAESYGVERYVQFFKNVPHEELRTLLSSCLVGLHTMENEHFGISVVEFMAAGCIPLAHKSGGPLLDIVVPHYPDPCYVGFLADIDSEYVRMLETIFSSSLEDLQCVSDRASEAASHFSDSRFKREFSECIHCLFS